MNYHGLIPWAQTEAGLVFLLGRDLEGNWMPFGDSTGARPTETFYLDSLGFLGTEAEILANLSGETTQITGASNIYSLEIKHDRLLPNRFKSVSECMRLTSAKYFDLDPPVKRHRPFQKVAVSWFRINEIPSEYLELALKIQEHVETRRSSTMGAHP